MLNLWRERVALLAILALAAALRFAHLDWDGFHHTHPDERYILFVASSLRPPEDIGSALTPARSPANPFRQHDGSPRPYPYGHVPLYATVATRKMLATWMRTAHPNPFTQLTLAGRALSALSDTLTVAATWALGRRLFGKEAGLLSAAFAALAVLHIQLAHFATVDTALAFFVTMALYFTTRVAEAEPAPPSARMLAGVFAGLAIGTKATGILLVLPLAAAYVRLRRDGLQVKPGLLQTSGAAILTFAVTNPYALLDFPLFARDLATQAAIVRGRLEAAFTGQYAGTLPLWYYVSQQAQWGLGLPLTVAGYTGLLWATWSWAKRRVEQQGLLPLLVWTWGTLLVVGTQFVKYPRYMLPATPMLFVLAGGLVQHSRKLRGPLAIVILLVTGLNALAFVRLYQKPHPWLAASEWLYAETPEGTVLAVEQGDRALPLDFESTAEPLLAAQHYEQRALDPYAADEDLLTFLEELAASDYYVIASNRLYGVVPRVAERYPLAATYYERLFDGNLGFRLERSFARYPNLPGLALVDNTFARPGLPVPEGLPESLPHPHWRLGYADESFTVYDHPLVMIFHNEEHLSAEEMAAVIEEDAGR